MAGTRRKDNKGRVLRSGESQRKNNTYQYRYTDAFGTRRSVYAATLQELREKEAEIEAYRAAHLEYASGNCSVLELVERYTDLKQGVRYNTRTAYTFVINILKKDEFGRRRIRDIRVSDAQLWFIQLQREGRGYSTITSIKGVLRPAFQMACNEDILPKNPFLFNTTDVVINNSRRRDAMTHEEQDIWMTFIRNDQTYRKYYDEFMVLLGTGMRVSEFCGLTLGDLDFKRRRIRVERQLVKERNGRYYVEKTKTQSGRRYLPMTDEVCVSLQNIIRNRPEMEEEPEVDGYSGFLLIDKKQQPKVALHIENDVRCAMKRFKKLNPDVKLPHITPHVFRHTFCTNLANAGMNVKSLQYLMGHSDVGTTLNIYTHSSYDYAADQLLKLVNNMPDGKMLNALNLTPNWRKMA